MAGESIRPSNLPARPNPVASEIVPSDNGSIVGGVTWSAGVAAARPFASQASGEAGISATDTMSPLTTKQAIIAQGDVRFASAAQGDLADSATQPVDLATVATSGAYADLSGKPSLGTMAAQNTSAWTPIARAVPTGGTTGLVLAKASNTNNDVIWADGAAPADGSVTLAKLNTALTIATPVMAKADALSVAFTRTGIGTASVKAGTVVKVGTVLVHFASDTAITMPTLVAGTDYAIFVSTAGAIQAVAWSANTGVAPTQPVGGVWTWIGGFHFAPGSNATAYNTGGNRTPQINAFSIWDLQFRPKCPDPRGMTLVAGKFWADIYFTGVDHHLNGTSRMGATIATGVVKPKLPLLFGGDGTTLVTELDWFWSNEILDSHGKRMMRHPEFRTAAFGVIEEAAGGRANAAVQTGINFNNNGGGTNNDERYTSLWGLNLSIANHYVWGQDLIGHTYNGAYTGGAQTAPQINPNYYQDYNGRVRGWSPQPGPTFARGSLFGGSVGSNAIGRSGSGSIDWANAVSSFSTSISVRGAADHLIL